MRVLIDMTHIGIGSLHASTSIYIFRILNSIDSNKKKNTILLIQSELKYYIKDNYPEYKYIIFPYSTENVIKEKKGIFRIIYQCKKYKEIVETSNCDTLFIANDQYLYTSVSIKLRKVSVIHDLKALKDKTFFEKIKYYIFYALLMKSSYKVIAISNYTKKDIQHYYGNFFSKKLEVVYNSIQLPKKSVRPQSIPEKTDYILYVNTLQKYKGIQTLLEAINLIENFNHKIVIIGKNTPFWTNYMIPYIKSNNLSNKIIHIQHVSDEELHYLYKNASLFVSCSAREGFGYTPIEAAICQCPVICSTCEALPETTLNLLEYYSPVNDAITLSNRITNILNYPPTPSKLKITSNLFLKKYSPKEQALKIYDLLINKN